MVARGTPRLISSSPMTFAAGSQPARRARARASSSAGARRFRRAPARCRRTFGTPPAFTSQLGHLPETQSRPRGRWYLKLCEKVIRPAAASAEAIVSPANASTGRPANRNTARRPRSITWPDASGPSSRGAAFGSRPGLGAPGPENLVGGCVALGEEPRPAAVAVIPPLLLHAVGVVAPVEVAHPGLARLVRARPDPHLAAVEELVGGALAALGAIEQEGTGAYSLSTKSWFSFFRLGWLPRA